MHQELRRGDTDETGTQTAQREPMHVASCSVIKAGVKQEEGGGLGVIAFVFPRKHHTVMSPAFLGVAEHLPASGQ